MAIGFYEDHLLRVRDPEFARLVEEYLTGGGAVGIMSAQPAIHCVVPARGATDSEWVLPYDAVRAILARATARATAASSTRSSARDAATSPSRCVSCSPSPRGSADAGSITHEEALAVLDEAERVGLVHTVSNVAEGLCCVCNCCPCGCGLLRGITEWGIEHSVAEANYFAEIDGETCEACGTCADRCQVGAIVEGADGVNEVRRESCIGCGLCVTGCPWRQRI